MTTHSEKVLLGLRLAVSKEKLSSNQVAVYHFTKGLDGSKPTRLKVTAEGIVEGWVPSFAEVDSKLLKAWLKELPEL